MEYTRGSRDLNSLETDFQLIKRAVWLLFGSNLLGTALLGIVSWALWSGLIPWAADTFSKTLMLVYFGFAAVCFVVIVPVQTMFIFKRLSEGHELAKKRTHTENYLVRLITTPFFGLATCWMAERDTNGRPVEGTPRFCVGFSTQDGKGQWSEAMKNRPTCEITAVEVTAVLDAKQQPRILIHEQYTVLIAHTYPKALAPLVNSFESAIYGKERSSKW